MDILKQALEEFPGGQVALANAIGTTPQFVSQMANGIRPVPPRLAIPIENALRKAVTRHDLCPDVFGPAPKRRKAA